ncbi:uncharacterized protein SAPINGB_P000707 [Magnusiomyces paraingens]|uniref:Translocation protein sec66 n=1 Tax=Magnusiomyces paraingens TaxID=2606893 RepID=A0A5E8B285_9ASCO|nr:uncharacterized protein SAPINGB_P000707 [Saprochaete ingens]VVT45309.1 unnamed protein product [Saprochaete ingens]
MAGKISVLTPLAYIFVIITSLVIFSSVYRRRKIQQLASLKPVYEQSFARNNYYTLKSQNEKAERDGLKKPIPEKLINAALIRWAGEDVRQIVKMKQAKEQLTALHQRGSIGDITYNKFVTNEKAIEIELQIISQEANSIKEGWANTIFNVATEVSQSDGVSARIKEASKVKEDYEKTLQKIRQRALAEL